MQDQTGSTASGRQLYRLFMVADLPHHLPLALRPPRRLESPEKMIPVMGWQKYRSYCRFLLREMPDITRHLSYRIVGT